MLTRKVIRDLQKRQRRQSLGPDTGKYIYCCIFERCDNWVI